MAGGRIKGITIELNGDSTKLEASLKSVNSEIRNVFSGKLICGLCGGHMSRGKDKRAHRG